MKYTRNSKGIKQIGKLIKKHRLKQNISQAQLAFEAGLPINQIGRIERGEINTSISHVLAIAKALNIHVKELFEFEIP